MSLHRFFAAVALIAVACGGGGSTPTSPGTNNNGNNNGNNNNNNTTQVGSVKGKVVDDVGAGVAGASIQLSATGQTTQTASSASDGSYTFNNVAVGVWTVSVNPPQGYTGGGTASVTVAANSQTTASTFTLAKVQTGPAATFVDVTITNESVFSPTTITVAKNGTVRWTNQDLTAHTATGQSFDTGNINTGQSKSVVFSNSGTFSYVCSIHPGMRGTVIVQ